MRRNRIVWVALTMFMVMAITGVAFGAARGATRSGLARQHSVRPAASISGACKAPKVSFVTNDTTSILTTSTTYVPVPGMSLSFSTTGTSCVVANFSSYAFATGGALLFVTATLDSVGGSPTESQYEGDTKGVYATARSAQFVWAGVRPGLHTVTVYFKSFSGATVALHRPVLVVDHK